jgi:hypothetical protein
MDGKKYLEVFMKRFISGMVLVLLVGLILSCTSTGSSSGGVYKPLLQDDSVIGSVQNTFSTANFDRMWGAANITTAINEQAYILLLGEAKKTYQGNIDIRNVLVVYVKFEKGQATYNATGDVISLNTGGKNVSAGVEGALARAAEEVSENFTARSRIAIVYITAEDKSQTDFIAGELEHILRRQGFVIIDRSELDRIRAEQRFGTSGEVDDNTAARIGNIAGASVVITGRVDGEGNLRRLRLRALNTDNGQVVGTASERL